MFSQQATPSKSPALVTLPTLNQKSVLHQQLTVKQPANFLIVNPCFTELEAEKMVIQYFGIKTKAKALVSFADQNFYLISENGKEFTLKIMNDSTTKETLQLQNATLSFLHGKMADFETPLVLPNLQGEMITMKNDDKGNRFYVRLLTWVKGDIWEHLTYTTPQIYEKLGEKLGKMTRLMQNFVPPSPLPSLKASHWDATQATWIYDKINLIERKEDRSTIRHFLDNFTREIIPQLPKMRHGFTHNDGNSFNIIVNKTTSEVTGLIDFGLMEYSKIVGELAVACAYLGMDVDDPMEVIAKMLRGFNRSFPLNDSEIQAILPLLANRIAISVTYSAINHKNGIESEYVYSWEKKGWNLLRRLEAICPQEAYRFFKNICKSEAVLAAV